MFKRSFMQAFKVRKNANPSSYLGSITSNYAIVGRYDRIGLRIGVYLITAFAMVNATNGFEVFYQMFTHYPQPAHRTYYQKAVPQNIRKANQQVIENWNKVHQANLYLKAFQVDA